jgi:putative flippase GtrA
VDGRLRVSAVWRRVPHRRTLLIYGLVGLISNVAYLVMFHAFQLLVAPLAANFLALLVTTIGNTAGHRRYTFRSQDRCGVLVAHLGGLAGMLISLAVSTAALSALDALDHQPSTLLATTTLWVATVLAAWIRFGPLRNQIGRVALGPDILRPPAHT